jgi:hypothetical protein
MAISGKPRELCIRALIAAHNIPDIAFEFLMNPDMIPPIGQEGAGYEDEPMDGEDVEGEDEEGVINLS